LIVVSIINSDAELPNLSALHCAPDLTQDNCQSRDITHSSSEIQRLLKPAGTVPPIIAASSNWIWDKSGNSKQSCYWVSRCGFRTWSIGLELTKEIKHLTAWLHLTCWTI